MDDPRAPQIPPAPVAELERRMRWRVVPTLLFLSYLAALAAVAAGSLLTPAPAVRGLPDDRDAIAARHEVENHVLVPTGGLRFGSVLTGEATLASVPPADDAARLARAAELLERAIRRRPFDARLIAARAHLELARRDHRAAETDYRRAIDLSRYFPEARLGLALALARRAEVEPDGEVRRGLRLEALGQLAAVREGDPEYRDALYDRALLSHEVGREAEARTLAAEYRLLDPSSAWTTRLEAALRRKP